jgi:hypothetical protein
MDIFFHFNSSFYDGLILFIKARFLRNFNCALVREFYSAKFGNESISRRQPGSRPRASSRELMKVLDLPERFANAENNKNQRQENPLFTTGYTCIVSLRSDPHGRLQ